MPFWRSILVHVLSAIALMVLAGGLATWRGALFPFDIRATALMTISGLLAIFTGWGGIWAGPILLSAAVRTGHWRIAAWLISLGAFVILHAAWGKDFGFVPLGEMGWISGLALYAVPTALATLTGSFLRTMLFLGKTFVFVGKNQFPTK